jgi:hypothetical protein
VHLELQAHRHRQPIACLMLQTAHCGMGKLKHLDELLGAVAANAGIVQVVHLQLPL